MGAPVVFSYLDFRTFLKDWLDTRRRNEPGYSYATFAADGGCSKSTIANVLSGVRTPRAATLDAFARAMDLSPAGRNYLGLLVDLSAAQGMDQRREVMDRILASEHYGQVRVAEGEGESTVFRYLEHWYIPAIRELAALSGFRADPAWIAGVLHPPITEAQAADALARLFDLEFVRRGSDGTVEVSEVQFRTEPEAHQDAVMHYYRDAIPDLLRQMERRPAEEQHVMAATISLAPDMVPEAKARLNAVVSQLASMADAASAGGERRVYQIAVQLLPVSEVIE